jgi:hypothetical protein
VPNSFSAGTAINAAAVNANFAALTSAVTSLETDRTNALTRIAALEGSRALAFNFNISANGGTTTISFLPATFKGTVWLTNSFGGNALYRFTGPGTSISPNPSSIVATSGNPTAGSTGTTASDKLTFSLSGNGQVVTYIGIATFEQ